MYPVKTKQIQIDKSIHYLKYSGHYPVDKNGS